MYLEEKNAKHRHCQQIGMGTSMGHLWINSEATQGMLWRAYISASLDEEQD